jgi:hypothetical protein
LLHYPAVDLERQGVDGAGELGVGPQFGLLGDEVVVGLGLLEGTLAVLADRKIASSETTSVSLGHGSDSTRSIHTANTTAWR